MNDITWRILERLLNHEFHEGSVFGPQPQFQDEIFLINHTMILDKVIKICLYGEAKSGKTAITSSFCYDLFRT